MSGNIWWSKQGKSFGVMVVDGELYIGDSEHVEACTRRGVVIGEELDSMLYVAPCPEETLDAIQELKELLAESTKHFQPPTKTVGN